MISKVKRSVVLGSVVVLGCNALLGNETHPRAETTNHGSEHGAGDAAVRGQDIWSGGAPSQSGGAAQSGRAGAYVFRDASGAPMGDGDSAESSAGKGNTAGSKGADGGGAGGYHGGVEASTEVACANGSKVCLGNGVITCRNGTWSAKVACDASLVCSGGECVPQPSCQGVKHACGATKDVDCCSSSVIPAGMFYRSYDGVTSTDQSYTFTNKSYPATLSEFRLDKYEVTVGRFRRFVQAYSRDLVSPGAGRNEHDPDDAGWDPRWTKLLPADAGALRAEINCGVQSYSQTWSDLEDTNEELPINCIDWYTAYAFCIWDGGRLPTEAEWNYAAAGGSEQRAYPWSMPPASRTIDGSYAYYNSGGSTAPTGPTYVGSRSPKGDGKWGQADLAGNLWEWTVDLYADSYPNISCNDCANLTAGIDRVFRGGDFLYDEDALLVSVRAPDAPTYPDDHGVRCARSP